jgi:hypothetical protein
MGCDCDLWSISAILKMGPSICFRNKSIQLLPLGSELKRWTSWLKRWTLSHYQSQNLICSYWPQICSTVGHGKLENWRLVKRKIRKNKMILSQALIDANLSSLGILYVKTNSLNRATMVQVYEFLSLIGYGVTFPFLFTLYKMLTLVFLAPVCIQMISLTIVIVIKWWMPVLKYISTLRPHRVKEECMCEWSRGLESTKSGLSAML